MEPDQRSGLFILNESEDFLSEEEEEGEDFNPT